MNGPSQETLRAFATADGEARHAVMAVLTAARLERGLTQDDIAALMGCPVQLVMDLDAGASGSVRLWAVQRYARSLGGRATVTVEFGDPAEQCAVGTAVTSAGLGDHRVYDDTTIP